MDPINDNLAEIIFNDYYDKYFLFSDIEKHLVPNNFRLVGMEINNNNIFQGAVFGANVYYMNNNTKIYADKVELDFLRKKMKISMINQNDNVQVTGKY